MARRFVFIIAMLLIGTQAQAFTFTDNFDDNSINSTWWTVSASGGSSVAETNQRIEMVQGANNNELGANLQFKLPITGAFTLQVDYQLLDWPTNNYERSGIRAANLGAVERISDSNYGGDRYLTHFNTINSTPTSDTSGKLQLTRDVAGDVKGWYWTGSVWQLINSVSYSYNGQTDIYLSIWPADYFNTQTYVRVAFDNFYLDAPEMIVPGAVPEPATLLLLGFGLAGLAGFRRHRQ